MSDHSSSRPATSEPVIAAPTTPGSASASSSTRARTRSRSPGVNISAGRDRQQLAAQLLDLVPELRGVLEPQLFRRGEHLLLERHYQPLELLRRHALDLGAT